MVFVLDASIAAAWMLPDEQDDGADRVMQALHTTSCLVPSLFWFEIRNLFLTAERRGRLRAGEALLSMSQLRALAIQDGSSGDHLVLELAKRRNLSGYDASYLALAVDRKVPLATCDKRLADASRREKVDLLGPLVG
ncbi:MAG: type II toxin-antitoxin system VapC family toxin [Hyphomicrobiales bacterium]|nr:type II toxin-antitoxin system VapC family toxin [Hyphomicrobiales bacterium]